VTEELQSTAMNCSERTGKEEGAGGLPSLKKCGLTAQSGL